MDNLPAVPPPPEFKKCPFCAEEIRYEAVICRFCQRDLFSNNPVSEKPESATLSVPAPLLQTTGTKRSSRDHLRRVISGKFTPLEWTLMIIIIIIICGVSAFVKSPPLWFITLTSSPTKENFDKIKEGMTRKDILSILGSPTHEGKDMGMDIGVNLRFPIMGWYKNDNPTILIWLDFPKSLNNYDSNNVKIVSKIFVPESLWIDYSDKTMDGEDNATESLRKKLKGKFRGLPSVKDMNE